MNLLKPIDQIQGNPLLTKPSYGFTSTRDIVSEFEKKGWYVSSEKNAAVRSAEKQGYQKHIIRMRNNDQKIIEGLSANNLSIPELIVLNSHDATSATWIFWGAFRTVCLNGIIAGTGVNFVRLTHSKSIVSKLPAAIDYMANNTETFKNQIVELQSKTFSEAALNEFIRRSFDARLANTDHVAVKYELPRVRRMADTGRDAYTIFNRVQETLLRGGIQYDAHNAKEVELLGIENARIERKKTRAVSSVTGQVNLNRLVYQNALELVS